MPKVYALQEPSRWDATARVRVPIVDLRPAAQYGDVEVLLPNNVSGLMMSPIVNALKEKLNDFTEDDYLIAIGDPSIIAAASGIILRRLRSMKMLKWDKRLKTYTTVEIVI